ncbi:MAG: cation transporter [Syntrophales bacterium]|nr:cation transporter [Syntrophales bacterium]
MNGIDECSHCSSSVERTEHLLHGRKLEYFTIGWNMVEAGVAIGAGCFADSIALVGFGVDSLIESISGSVLLWRLSSPAHDESRERIALKLVGISFLFLAAYVAFDAIKSLLVYELPHISLVGIVLSVVSLIIMPVLARAKRRAAANLGSRAMKADSRQTYLCAYLSAILLGGLALNALFGWWWADPVAALIMVPIIAREGFEGLRGEVCDDCH